MKRTFTHSSIWLAVVPALFVVACLGCTRRDDKLTAATTTTTANTTTFDAAGAFDFGDTTSPGVTFYDEPGNTTLVDDPSFLEPGNTTLPELPLPLPGESPDEPAEKPAAKPDKPAVRLDNPDSEAPVLSLDPDAKDKPKAEDKPESKKETEAKEDAESVDASPQKDAPKDEPKAAPDDNASSPADSQVAKGPDVAAAAKQPSGLDWTYCRGPFHNNTSPETGLPDDFDPDGGEGSNVRWKRDDLGTRSTPIVMDGRVYILARAAPGTPKEGERILCLDLDSGETIWEQRWNVWLSDVPDTRVAWSAVVADPDSDHVYVNGVCGYFACFEAKTGKLVWDVPLHEKFGALSTYGGRTNFPIVFDDLVITSAIVIGWGEMAKPSHVFIGMDKMTGEVVWFNGTRPLPYDTTYSPPALATIEGQKLLVAGSGDGAVWALQPRTGALVWHYPFSRRGLNVGPLVVGDTVYSGHSEENTVGTSMGSVVALDATGKGDISKSGELWKRFELMVGKTSPLMVEDKLYIFDDRAKLYILDPKTGEQLTRKALGTVMRSTPLYADGKLYVFTADGRWYILKPDGDDVETLARGRLDRSEEVNGAPVVSHGRVLFASTDALYCLEDESKEHGLGKLPPQSKETPVEENPEPAFVQISPAESLIRPGEKIDFRVRLFNANGQFLNSADEVSYTVEGQGEISGGVYTAPADAEHQGVVIKAKVGDLVGQARTRIVPGLPWEFDFEKLEQPPVSWVGARYRHIMRNEDGNKVMVKITTIPKGTRSRAWFGHTDLSDYTIEADVKSALMNDKMADIGLINQGYTLDLQGENQELQARTWVTQLRMANTIGFQWEPDTWYKMKLSVSHADGKAYVRGKVWPRTAEEPQEWTIEAVDESPNQSGSPGLYGNAKDAELFLDNIKVYQNK